MAGRIGSLADYMEGGRSSAKLTWERSGFGPPDVDVAQIYDGFSASVANHFRLFIIPGMDHSSLPAQTWPRITEAGF